MIFIAECYANKCIAEKLRSMIIEENKQSVEVVHNRKMGRDRILKAIINFAKRTKDLIVAVIDYERGISRVFIDTNFSLRKVYEGLWVGQNKKLHNVLAIIFDPNIEDGFLYKIAPWLRKDSVYIEKLKSNEACTLLSRLVQEPRFQEILHQVLEKLKEL